MYKEEVKVKLSITKKRTYYGKPPLTEDEVVDLINKRIKKTNALLSEALDVFCGFKKIREISPTLKEAILEHNRSGGNSTNSSRSNIKGSGKKRRNLLSGSKTQESAQRLGV